ncbi:MAG: nucleotidyltransferase domain-containing protein [Candidatus Brockarchaeota archaeon]|nr:nucleotidyltransferase domain-containing protein [Candidatus Brockarchaeota archaeon]
MRDIPGGGTTKILVEELGAREEVVFAVMFGSFLEGKGFHDIDVGIYVDRKAVKDEVDASAYADEVSGRLTKKAGVPVDIVVLNFAPMWLTRRALKGALLVDRDPILRAALRLASIDNTCMALKPCREPSMPN